MEKSILRASQPRLYSEGLKSGWMWGETYSVLARNMQHETTANEAKDLGLTDVTLAQYLTNKFGLILDMCITSDSSMGPAGGSLILLKACSCKYKSIPEMRVKP